MSRHHQAEAKKLEDSSLYLSLPATKLEMEEKGHLATGKNTQVLGNCTISKDSFQISTLVCSTKLTQNGRYQLNRLHIPSLLLALSFFFFLFSIYHCFFLFLSQSPIPLLPNPAQIVIVLLPHYRPPPSPSTCCECGVDCFYKCRKDDLKQSSE